MATVEKKTLPELFSMNGGQGPHSYALNSILQKGMLDDIKEMINNVIAEKLDVEDFCLEPTANKFVIADLGCSSGSNTFLAVKNIIEPVEHKYHNSKHKKPPTDLEFLVYFNDLTQNDFNTLFRSLPPSGKFFAAGVPGSFYGRLFPESTIHFFHSSNSLHWLSRVPEELENTNSPAWNKESVYCTGNNKEVTEAYAAQSRKDLETFLQARAKELVVGGLMVILISSIPKGVPPSQSNFGRVNDIFGSCLVDMAKKGLVSEEKVNSFNLPLYFPSSEDLVDLINENGHFSIERMETPPPTKNLDLKIQIERMALHIRAANEALIKNHFGNVIVEELYECFTKKLMESRSIFVEDGKLCLLSIVLKRKKY